MAGSMFETVVPCSLDSKYLEQLAYLGKSLDGCNRFHRRHFRALFDLFNRHVPIISIDEKLGAEIVKGSERS